MSKSLLAGFVQAVVVLALLPLSQMTAKAGSITTFLDQTAWENASKGIASINFSGLGGSNYGNDQHYIAGLTVDGVTFTGSDFNQWTDGQYLYVRNLESLGGTNILYGLSDGSAPAFWTNSTQYLPGAITVTLPAGVTSVGWDFANFYTSGAYGVGSTYTTGLTVIFSDGTIFSDSNPNVLLGNGGGEYPNSVFIGFTSSTPITSFEILGPGYPTVSNFSFGSSAAPEPGSLALMALGLFALNFCRKHSAPVRGRT
jgi:hypothetical protein